MFGRILRSGIVSFKASVVPEGNSKQVVKVQTKRRQQICAIKPPKKVLIGTERQSKRREAISMLQPVCAWQLAFH